jgi:hypothetical protein
VSPVLLHASSDAAAQAVVRALTTADIMAAGFMPGTGRYAVWVKVPEQREPEAMNIAVTIDPRIRPVRRALPGGPGRLG